MTTPVHDFAIVGAGIAGTSLAAELSTTSDVVMLEAEDHPGYHATGRSAAFWEECYGGPDIVPLTLASERALRAGGFLNRRGALYIGRGSDHAALDSFMQRFAETGATISRIGQSDIAAHIPGIRSEWTGAIWEPACCDIDVGGLHAEYLARARRQRAVLHTRFRMAGAARSDGIWTIRSTSGAMVRAQQLVNAAGAWADEIARLAGCKPVGITPLRRTVIQLRVDRQPPADMPLVLDIGGSFYFKPEAGRIWLSPHDEAVSQPCDAAPEEMAVALAIQRLGEVTDWRVQAVERKWAGLRSFAPDRLPVHGPDSHNPDFIWFAGQGGSGIQTAPAAARLVAAQMLGNTVPDDLVQINAAQYASRRFA
ncbi:NAD(P)/FAD-dependent oxidoreductase [Pontixanthobacter sp.]|uniref:NAD(P)/FAD-dependent oxidoreductase n=1 Tax=Pontixanthobacter sp. TaxID=2792078 RepID=UPI003C7AB48A